MACIPFDQWNKARSDCAAMQSVRGYGAFGADPQISQADLSRVLYADPNDPCTIAAQTPCSSGIQALPGAVAITRKSVQALPGAVAINRNATPPGTPAPTPATQASAFGGLGIGGILALVAVGGFIIYQVSKKKAS